MCLHRTRILQGTATKQQKSSAPVDEEDDDDDDFDLFGSDEDDTEAEKIKQQRVTEYAARKAKKPVLIAKSSILLDVKPVCRPAPVLHTHRDTSRMAHHSPVRWILLFVTPDPTLPLLLCSGTTRRTWRSWRSACAQYRLTACCGVCPSWSRWATASESCRSPAWWRTTRWGRTCWRRRSPSLRTT